MQPNSKFFLKKKPPQYLETASKKIEKIYSD